MRALLVWLLVVFAALGCGDRRDLTMGLGIGCRLDLAANAIWNPMTIANLAAWWQADDTPESTTPRWGDDSGNQRMLSAASSAASPVYGATAVGGRPGLAFSGTQKIQADSPYHWIFLHDGTGCTVVLVAQPGGSGTTNVALDTSNAAGVGLMISHDGTNDRWVVTLRNGTGQIASIASSNGAHPEGAAYVVVVTYSESASPKLVLRVNGVQAATSGTSASPSTAEPAAALTLGSQTGGSNVFAGAIRTCMLFKRVLSATELGDLESNVATVASPRTKLKRVWTVGDSITAGTYQDRLWKRGLLSNDTRIDFLGTLSQGTFPLPDLQDNGHSGQRTDQIQTLIAGANLGVEPTDIVVIAGTNDVFQSVAEATIETNYTSLVNAIKAAHPTSKLWLGRPPRMLTAQQSAMETFASWVASHAAGLGGTYVNTDVADNVETSVDNVHPTTPGYRTLGNSIADALGISVQAAPFAPSQCAEGHLWAQYQADVGISSSGGLITQIADQGPYGFHLIASTNKLATVTDGGLAAIQATGTSAQYARTAAPTGASITSADGAYTLAIVTKVDTAVANNWIAGIHRARGVRIGSNSGTRTIQHASSGSFTGGSTPAAYERLIISMQDVNLPHFYINGVRTALTGAPGYLNATPAGDFLCIGYDAVSTKGYVRAFLWFDRALSIAQILALDAWLAARWP